MPATFARPEARMTGSEPNARSLSLPVCGVSGGWRDLWDAPDDHAELRAQAERAECRTVARALVLGVVMRRESARDCVSGRDEGHARV